MAPEERDYAYLWDMLQSAVAALSYVQGLSKEEAIGDEMRMAAFERKLEVLGEAAKRISPQFTPAGGTCDMPTEQDARAQIDKLLTLAGWDVQDCGRANIHTARSVALRECPLPGHGFADYLLYVGQGLWRHRSEEGGRDPYWS